MTEFLGSPVELLPWPLFIAAVVVAVSALLVVPMAAYIAIFKYGVYSIGVIINRTLVYGVLTVTLVLIYFGGVTATDAIFSALTG